MEIRLNIEEQYSTTFLAFLQTLSYVKVQNLSNNGFNHPVVEPSYRPRQTEPLVKKGDFDLEKYYCEAYAATAKEDLALTKEFEPIDFEHLD